MWGVFCIHKRVKFIVFALSIIFCESGLATISKICCSSQKSIKKIYKCQQFIRKNTFRVFSYKHLIPRWVLSIHMNLAVFSRCISKNWLFFKKWEYRDGLNIVYLPTIRILPSPPRWSIFIHVLVNKNTREHFRSFVTIVFDLWTLEFYQEGSIHVFFSWYFM